MKRLVVAAILCIAASAWAQSTGGDNKHQQKKAAEDKRGTMERPLVVHGIPAEKDKEQAGREYRYQNEQILTGRQLSDTLLEMKWEAFFLTLGLVLVGVGQAWLFYRQLRFMRVEYAASHPPKLVARAFRLHPRKGNTPPGVEFLLGNEGGSSAFLDLNLIANDIRMTADMASLEEGAFPDLSRAGQNIIQHREYSPSKRIANFIVLHGLHGDQVMDENINKVLDGTAGFVFAGIIRYNDNAGVTSELRFFRRFVQGKKYLQPHPNPDYDSGGDPNYYERDIPKPPSADRFAWRGKRRRSG